MRTTFLCDFDGTIAPADIGAGLVRRFAPGSAARLDALEADWRAGRIGSRELTLAQCAMLRVSEAEALAFVRGFGLDPAFAPFAREALARGDQVTIVSDGFDFYLRDRLDAVGLGDLPRAGNLARFEGDRMIPSFPFAAAGCGRCANCKAQHVDRAREQGDRVVVVGDGASDRCAAELADIVFARGELLDWCRGRGIPAHPFDDFAAVAAFARGRTAEPTRPAATGTEG